MLFKRFLAKALRIPRRLRMTFYVRYNRLKFWLNRVEAGRNMLVYNSIYLNKSPGSSIRIGDDFVFTSGEAFNPLCRNIRGCIYTAYPGSRIFIANETGLSSACLWDNTYFFIGKHEKVGDDPIIFVFFFFFFVFF